MKKTEKMQLEIDVLRNIIDCVRQEIDIYHADGQKLYEALGRIDGITEDLDKKLDFAMHTGEAMDYRRSV